MAELDEEKSLSAWRAEIKQYGRVKWLAFYASLLGSPVSNVPRFFKTIKLYGDFAMFEAIVAASGAELTGDPLAYVCKIASNKWKESVEDEEEEEKLMADIEHAKKISQKKNDELARKIKRAEKKKNVRLESTGEEV